MTRGPLHTALCDLLGIVHPLILAGMANGPSTAELAAAVSDAGGLGTVAATGLGVEAAGRAVERACALTDRPIAVNVLISGPTPARGDAARLQSALADLGAGVSAGDPAPPPAPAPSPSALVEACLAAGARAVSVGLGDPTPVATLARAAGVPLIAMVTSAAEAERVVAAGADAVVAQGSEAGGHRSTLDPDPDRPLPLVGTMALVPQVADAIGGVPVIAAGGIVDGRGVAAALALGAAGAQLGTRFLAAQEAGIPESYRDRLRRAADTESVVTWAVTGRPARGLPNRLLRTLEGSGASLGWPAQGAATGRVRAAAAVRGDADLMALWAGQAAGMVGATLPAARIVADLVRDAHARLTAWG